MSSQQYPRVGIYPAHCGVYRTYHDKNGDRHIQDGPYTERRKIRSENGQNFILLAGTRVPVKRISDRDELVFVAWETTPTP